MKREVAVFAIIFVGMTWVIDTLHLPHADEVWLLSGIVAAQVFYWIRSNFEENYLKFTGPILLVVFAAYIIAVKAPKLLSGLMNYRLAQLLCFMIYVSVCWVIIKKRDESFVTPEEPYTKSNTIDS